MQPPLILQNILPAFDGADYRCEHDARQAAASSISVISANHRIAVTGVGFGKRYR
jgi:hypothetical protein